MRKPRLFFLSLFSLATATGAFFLVHASAQSNPSAPQAQQESVWVLRGGTLIDGTGAPPQKNVEIVIQGDRIAAAGKQGSVQYPSSARVVNADNKYILPGLIDSHVHFANWDGELFLYHGVTSVKDTGNITNWILAQRRAINTGKMAGPRLFTSGGAITKNPVRGPGYEQKMGVDNAEQARQATRQLLNRGVDLIKLSRILTSEFVGPVAEEAHARGVLLHGHIGFSAVEAARLGMDVLEHATGVAEDTSPAEELAKFVEQGGQQPEHLMDPARYDSVIRTLVEEEVFLTPTLVVFGWGMNPHVEEYRKFDMQFIRDPGVQYVPWDTVERVYAAVDALSLEERERLKTGYRKLQEFLRRFRRAGGKILAGTDAGLRNITGLGVHREMQLLVDSGLTPMEAIQSATLLGAQALRKDKLLGTIEPGKLADLLVVEADPLTDITNTQKIALVIQGGQIIERKLPAHYRNPIPRPFPSHFGGPTLTPQSAELLKLYPALPYFAPTLRDAFPLPLVESVSATEFPAGSPPQTVRVKGKDFTPQSQVLLDGTKLATRFISAGELEATIPRELLNKVGRFTLFVFNPGSGGAVSNNFFLLVTYPD